MGGFGSGRSWGYGRPTVESCRAIDVRQWRRKGLLTPGRSFSWQWFCDGEATGSITVAVDDDAVKLLFKSRDYGDDEWQKIEQLIQIDRTPCHLGGERPWFRCGVYVDGAYCGRRVAKLYAGGRYFACRHCYQLAYQSQREAPHDRAMSKAQKIRMRLGGSASMLEHFPDKPKGMHWRTYWRLRDEAEHCEMSSWIGVAQRFGRYLP